MELTQKGWPTIDQDFSKCPSRSRIHGTQDACCVLGKIDGRKGLGNGFYVAGPLREVVGRAFPKGVGDFSGDLDSTPLSQHDLWDGYSASQFA